MNLSQVRKLQHGDIIKFKINFPSFTVNQHYEVKKTDVGIYIVDDEGIGRPLTDLIETETHFGEI